MFAKNSKMQTNKQITWNDWYLPLVKLRKQKKRIPSGHDNLMTRQRDKPA